MGKDLKIGMSFDIDWKKTYNEAREGFKEMSKDLSNELVDAVMDAFDKINKASAFGADLSSLYETLTRDITNANGDAKLIASATKMFDARIKFLSDLNKKIFEDTKIENATDGLTKSQVKQLMDLYEVRIDQENKVKKYKASSYKTEVYNENGFEDLESISNYFRPKNKKNTYTNRVLKFVKDNSKKYGITDDIAKNLETPLKEYANMLDVLDSVKNRKVKENSIEAVKQQRAIEFLVKEINSQTSSNALLKDFNENELKITLPDPQEVWKVISGYVEKQVQSVLSNTSWRREAINKVVSFRNQNLRNAEINNEKIIQASKNINNNKADDSNSGNKGGNGSGNGSVGNGSTPPNSGVNQDYKNKYFIKNLEEVSEKFLFAAQQFNQSYGDSKFTKDETKDIFKDAIAYLARYEDLGGNKENLIDKTGLPNIIKGLFKKGFSGESQIINGINGLPDQLKEIINSVHALKDMQEDVGKNEGTIGNQTNNVGNNNKGSDNQENNDKGNNNRNDNVAKNNDRDTKGDNQGFGISDESANKIITELGNIKQAINECKEGIVDELKNDINTSISSISEKLGGDNKIDNSQLERIITEIAGLGDKLGKLNSIPSDIKDSIVKSYGNAADIILDQIAANNLMVSNGIKLRERSLFFNKSGNITTPFFEGDEHNVPAYIVSNELVKQGIKADYQNHTHSYKLAHMSTPSYDENGNLISGDIVSFYNEHLRHKIEEQIICGLEQIEVFRAKDFYEKHKGILNKKYDKEIVKDGKKKNVKVGFEEKYADEYEKIYKGSETKLRTTMELSAIRLLGKFDKENLENVFGKRKDLSDVVYNNIDRYLEYIFNNAVDKEKTPTSIGKLEKLLLDDGISKDDSSLIVQKIREIRARVIGNKNELREFMPAFDEVVDEYIMKNVFGVDNFKSYFKKYNLKNENDVAMFKEKYNFDARMINEIQQDSKQESSNLPPLSSSLDEVIEKIKEKNDLFNEEQSIVSIITESEVNDLNKVRDAVNEISEAVERKNDLLNDVQQSPTSHSSSVELNEEKSENDLTTSTEPTNIISFEELAKEEIEYTKNQIKGLKDYIFNTNSDECGLFAKYLFGEDGNLKTEKQVIAELETMIDEFYKGTRTDTEEIFRLWRAAESTNLLKGYNFDYKWMRPSFEEWMGNHDDNNQWLTKTDRMSDEAHSMFGHLIEEEEKLSILQKNNGEDFVNYLREAKELSKEIYQFLDKYKNYSPSDKDSILDSDITQEQAKEKGDLLEKESDKADDLIKKYEALIEKYNEFKKNRNISSIENDPLGRYGIANDLKDLSDKLLKESGIYSDISLLRHARKIKSQLDVYENDTRIDRAYNDNKLYPIAEGIDTEIYRGAISAQEGIEKFIAKTKELGYEFDEVANKWVRVETVIDNTNRLNDAEQELIETQKELNDVQEQSPISDTTNQSNNLLQNETTIDTTPTLLDVKPNLTPEKFAQEVTDLLKETNAEIGVEPLIDAEEFVNEINKQLVDKLADIKISPDIDVTNIVDNNQNNNTNNNKNNQNTNNNNNNNNNQKDINDLLSKQEQAYKRQLKLKKDLAKLDSDKNKEQYLEIERQEKEQENLVATLGQRIQTLDSTFDISKRINDLQEKYKSTLDDIVAIEKSRLDTQNNVISNTNNKNIKNTINTIDKLIESLNKLNEKSNEYPIEYLIRIQKVMNDLKDARRMPAAVIDKEIKGFKKRISEIRNMDKLPNDTREANNNSISKLTYQISNFMKNNSRMSKESKAELQGLIDKLNQVGLTVHDLKDVSNAFNEMKTNIIQAGLAGNSLFDTFKRKIITVTAQQIATYFSFNDIIRYGRTAAQTVINLNTQFTELAKVSDTSVKQLERDFTSYASTAKEVGGTISDTISATADWARMGYNLPDSKELARVALIYKNVGDGIDISTANESLISTLQGFQMEATDAMEIIDKFNEVSNNFAISSSGIGEALKRSAASFNASGTSLSKSIALVTSANTVLQNPEQVGTIWKTMSARLRGAKTELEDLGEEEDEFTESTSKLKNLVKSLTGFDIMKDKDTFKDIYDIMIGIGEKWDDLTDVEQASLGEALAGKRNANALYAVLNNIDTLKDAYKTAEESEGSAMREQLRYQESIQYSIDRVKASFEEFASSVIDSGLLKYVIDLSNAFVNVATAITKIGNSIPIIGSIAKNSGTTALLGGAIGMATGVMNKGLIAHKQIGDAQLVDVFGIRSRKYLKQQNQNKLAGLQSGFDSLTKYEAYKKALRNPENLKKGWENAFGNADEDVKKLAKGLEDGSTTSDQFRTSLQELISSTEESGKKIKLSTSLFSGFKNVLKGIGSGLLLAGISLAVDTLISAVYELATVDDKVAELANEASTSIQKTNSSIDEYKTKLEDLNKTIHSNSSTEEEIYNARKEMLDLQNSLVETFGKEAEGINLVTMSYDKQIRTLNELQRKKNDEDLRKFNSEGGWANNFSNWIHGYDGNIDRLEKKYFQNETITLKMSYGVGDISDEYIKKLREAGAKFKGSRTNADIDPSDVVTYGYEEAQMLSTSLRDIEENEAVQLSDLIEFSGTAEEIYEQAVAIKRITGENDSFERLNNELDDIIEKYGKLKDELGDIAKQHVLNDYIFSEDPENKYDEYFYRLANIEDEYQDALLSGDEKTMQKVVNDYNQLKDDIDGTDLEMFDKAAEDQIHKWFENAGKDIQATVDEWDITAKIKDVDISALEGKTREDLEKLLTLNDFRSLIEKYVKDYQEAVDKGELSDSKESQEVYIRSRLKLDDIDIENSGDLAKDLGLNAREYELIVNAITDGTYDTLDTIKLLTDDTSKALDVLGIKSAEVLAEEGKLTKTIVDSAKAAKDSMASLSDTLEKLKSGKLTSSEIIDFLSSDDNSEFIQSATNLEEALINKRNSLRKSQIDSLKDLSDEERKYWESITKDALNQAEFDAHINQLNEDIDKLQEGMKTLSSAFDEYNENGFITLDTFQSLMADNGEYIQMLTIENGQLKINEEAYKNIMAAKLNDFKATLDKAAAAEINALAEENAEGKTRSNIQALNEETIAYSENTREAIKNATKKGVSEDEINNIINKYDTIWDTALKGYNKNFKQFSGLANSSAKDAQTKAKELLDNYIAVQDALLDAGKISFADYCKNVKGKLDEMYNSGKISAKDYFDSVKTFLEKQQSIYDKILNAVTRRFDKEIEGIDKQITAINEENDALNKQKDEYDKILSVVQEVYDKEIESLQNQQEAIQDKIDALQKANDEEDRALALANARYALEKAQQQRTRLVYNGAEGFVYQTDPEAIRDAKKELKDVELENTISALEEEKEALDKNIEALEEYKEKWSEVSGTYDKEVNRQLAIALWGENYEQMILQNREQDIQDFTDKYVELQKKVDDNTSLIESLEEKKQVYEELKKEWQDITSVYEQSIEDQLAAEYFGADWESQILSGRKATLEQFKDAYISIQEQIREAALRSAEAQEKAAAAGSGNTGNIPVTTSDTSTQNKVRNVSYLESDEGVIQEIDDIKEYVKTHARDLQNPYVRIKTEDITGYGVYDEKDKNYKKQVKSFETLGEALKFVDENKERKWKIRAIQAFAKGGVINANNNNPLNSIASKLGEDTAVLARHGERILTPVQNQYWEKWTNAIPNLTKHLEKLKFNTPNLSSILNAVASKETTVKQEISISLPNVTNTSGAEYVLNALKTLPLEAVQRVNRR